MLCALSNILCNIIGQYMCLCCPKQSLPSPTSFNSHLLPYSSVMSAKPLLYLCNTSAVPLQCLCSTSAAPLQYLCSTSAMPLQYLCNTSHKSCTILADRPQLPLWQALCQSCRQHYTPVLTLTVLSVVVSMSISPATAQATAPIFGDPLFWGNPAQPPHINSQLLYTNMP